MICFNPEDRWTAEKLLQHCWLTSKTEEVEAKCCAYNSYEPVNVQTKKNPFWMEPEFVIPIAAGLVLGGIISILFLTETSEKKTKQ